MAEQRYRVVERLEAGGMAEVFVGEQQSVQGFKKRVAIKRVLPHLAQNKNFIAMFLDEARLGARLNHANIVTVFDIGAADNTFFIVMEYIDGANLKTLIEALRKQGRRFPLKEAIYICMEACRGLSYAHELADEGGTDLHIVHRDVSPPNIMISRRGEVKVTDFGLAKATTQLEKTDPGVVKGKFSYLAPEAALGQDVDARADVFALGIVLWEMLAGRRLFLGETDYQTVKLVQQANIPSLQRLNPEVDSEFERVLLQALTRDPNDRFQSAREFGDALAGYLFSHQMKVTSYDLANLLKGALAAEKKPKTQDQSIIDRLIQEELLRFTSLEDMSEQSAAATPLSPEDVDGAQPLDAMAFENPADWFTDDAEVAAAIGGHSSSDSQPGWREAGLERGGSEDLAALLESEGMSKPPAAGLGSQLDSEPPTQMADMDEVIRELRRTNPDLAVPSAPAAPLDAPPARVPQRRPVAPAQKAQQQSMQHPPPKALPSSHPRLDISEPPPPRPAKSGGAWKIILFMIVLLAGGAAAAWFGGVIPH